MAAGPAGARLLKIKSSWRVRWDPDQGTTFEECGALSPWQLLTMALINDEYVQNSNDTMADFMYENNNVEHLTHRYEGPSWLRRGFVPIGRVRSLLWWWCPTPWWWQRYSPFAWPTLDDIVEFSPTRKWKAWIVGCKEY